ncbi:MAG: S8 family serine peptidase, partial [bacterium]
MKHHILCLTISVLVILVFGCEHQPTQPTVQDEPQSPVQFQYADHYIVQYNNPIQTVKVKNLVLAKGGEIYSEWDEFGFTVVRRITEEDAAALQKIAGVKSVTRDIIVRWIPEPGDIANDRVQKLAEPEAAAHDSSGGFDTYQWNMRQIGADKTWDAGYNGDGALVAILDTGINPEHVEMAGRVDLDLSRTFVTSSPYPPDLTSFDDFHFHGTHVAGIISANGIVTAGVAPHATLVAVKVLNAYGSGSFRDLISGILYATEIGVDVINLSLGAYVPNTDGFQPLVEVLSTVVKIAMEAGVYVVAAAGNDARELLKDGDLLFMPAQADERIAVISATAPINQTDFDRLASYSNFGGEVISVAAPGGDFLGILADRIVSPCSPSSIHIPDCQTGNDWYFWAEGTSQAAPHVSGAAALLDARFGGELKGEEIRGLIERAADNLGNPSAHGSGRLDVFEAVVNAFQDPVGDEQQQDEQQQDEQQQDEQQQDEQQQDEQQ